MEKKVYVASEVMPHNCRSNSVYEFNSYELEELVKKVIDILVQNIVETYFNELDIANKE